MKRLPGQWIRLCTVSRSSSWLQFWEDFDIFNVRQLMEIQPDLTFLMDLRLIMKFSFKQFIVPNFRISEQVYYCIGGKIMSNQLKELLNVLQGNMEVVGEFFDNPQKVIKDFGITGKEKAVLLIRDLSELDDYALAIQNSVATPSGAHSSTCRIVRPEPQAV